MPVGVGLLSVQAVLAIGVILAGILLGQPLQGVLKTVLFLSAEEGTRPREFDSVNFEDFAGDTPGTASGRGRSTVSDWR